MMNASSVKADLQKKKITFFVLRLLQLTGYKFPPPAQLSDGDTFDYIVVGAGTAGTTVATRLAEHKYQVLLIEAGADAPYESEFPGLVTYIKESYTDWNYTSTADKQIFKLQPSNKVPFVLGKEIGGTSEAGYMIYARGQPFIYDKWAEITDDPGWSYASLLPYFKKTEAIDDVAIMESKRNNSFGYTGYIGVTRVKVNEEATKKFLKAFKQVERKVIPDIDGARVGYARGLVTIANGTRQGVGWKYFEHIHNNPYILVAKGTLAIKIVFDKNNRAIGVKVITDENKKITVKARQEIIISCGAVNTAKLLLLSGIGPKKQLDGFGIPCLSDLPVGKNLQDHTAVPLPYATNLELTDKSANPGQYPSGLFVGYESIDTNVIDRSIIRIPDYQVLAPVIDSQRFLLEFCLTALNYPVETCDRLNDGSKNKQVVLALVGNIYTKCRGEVRLSSKDPKEMPIIDLGTFKDNCDFNDLIEFIKHFRRVENTTAFKELDASLINMIPECDDKEKDSIEFYECYIRQGMISLSNLVGTCALGSVVDNDLKVMNTSGLSIADGSVMPIIPSCITLMPNNMIGEVAAEKVMIRAGDYNNEDHEKIPTDEIKNMPNDNDL